jgi:predicted transcriptional regulator
MTVRTTVSIPDDQHKKLQVIAEANGLSLSWVIRQAVSNFLSDLDKQGDFDPLTKREKS